MTFSELAAQTSQPCLAQMADFSTPSTAPAAPQSWFASVADAKLHWYDLIAGFPERPDIHDPIGRYQRRMQFELEATAEQHHLFFAITRPRVRFNTAAAVQWGFFSLKLTLPLLLGIEQVKDSLTIELTAPFAATLKKPIVSLTPNFVTLNWGGLAEVFSVHDILQTHAPERAPSRVFYVGQTRDSDARLARARLPALQKLHAKHKEDVDTLLLVHSLELVADSAHGDPAGFPQNTHPTAAAALQRARMDVIETALIRHFEGAAPLSRKPEERQQRRERMAEVQQCNNLVQFTLDLQWPQAGSYGSIGSEQAPAASHHLLSCFIADGETIVSKMSFPKQEKGARAHTA